MNDAELKEFDKLIRTHTLDDMGLSRLDYYYDKMLNECSSLGYLKQFYSAGGAKSMPDGSRSGQFTLKGDLMRRVLVAIRKQSEREQKSDEMREEITSMIDSLFKAVGK